MIFIKVEDSVKLFLRWDLRDRYCFLMYDLGFVIFYLIFIDDLLNWVFFFNLKYCKWFGLLFILGGVVLIKKLLDMLFIYNFLNRFYI